MAVREADFAGSWYPQSERECRRSFDGFEERCVEPQRVLLPCGGIVPHAGWIYSGPIAYNVIRELARRAPATQTVLLFGGHLRPSSTAAVMTHGDFWTPLGAIPTDEELAVRLADELGLRREDPRHHTPDNTVELQAPMLRHLLPAAQLVVVSAPPRPETLALADAAVALARELGRSVVALGSTDLTHYGPNYGWAPEGIGATAERWVREVNDRRFVELACALEPQAALDEGLASTNACCPGAAAAALRCGRQLGATVGELLTYATSADVRRDPSFVGYAGVLF